MNDSIVAFAVIATGVFVGTVLAKIAWFAVVMERILP